MDYNEREALVKSLTPEQLGKTQEDRNFRYALILLLADVASQLQTSAYSHRTLLKLQQERSRAVQPPKSEAKA